MTLDSIWNEFGITVSANHAHRKYGFKTSLKVVFYLYRFATRPVINVLMYQDFILNLLTLFF